MNDGVQSNPRVLATLLIHIILGPSYTPISRTMSRSLPDHHRVDYRQQEKLSAEHHPWAFYSCSRIPWHMLFQKIRNSDLHSNTAGTLRDASGSILVFPRSLTNTCYLVSWKISIAVQFLRILHYLFHQFKRMILNIVYIISSASQEQDGYEEGNESWDKPTACNVSKNNFCRCFYIPHGLQETINWRNGKEAC